MSSTGFDGAAWRQMCSNIQVSCADRSMSPMHALFIFSQAIDDALQDLDIVDVGQAFDIAREYGYESSLERAEFVSWFADSSSPQASPQASPKSPRIGRQ